MMSVKAVDALVEAKFAYEQAREGLYYGRDGAPENVYEALDAAKFDKVARTLGIRPSHSERNGVQVWQFEYRGCVFIRTQLGEVA